LEKGSDGVQASEPNAGRGASGDGVGAGADTAGRRQVFAKGDGPTFAGCGRTQCLWLFYQQKAKQSRTFWTTLFPKMLWTASFIRKNAPLPNFPGYTYTGFALTAALRWQQVGWVAKVLVTRALYPAGRPGRGTTIPRAESR